VRRGAAFLAALVAVTPVAVAGCDDDGSSQMTTVAGPDADGAKKVIVESQKGVFSPEAIYAQSAPGVVTVISVLDGGSTPLEIPDGVGQGSGFVLNDDGEIATNAHVVTDAEAAGGGGSLNEAKEVYVQFPDRNQVPAEIVGFDPFVDAALLRVDPEGIDLAPLELGPEDEIDVGEPVAAIGSPFGQRQSLSIGIVSATDRSVQSLTDFQIDGAIQTDASINPGNSGGPLLDAEGRVIGMNQQINTTSGGNQGVGFAIPIDLIARSLDDMRDDGQAEYAYLGVTTASLYPQLADRLEIDADTGALVTDVVEDGPADQAGIQGADRGRTIQFQGQEIDIGGDVIVAVDGDDLSGQTDLPRLVFQHKPGDRVTLEVLRDGDRMEIEVELGARPAKLAP
jgi:S1-C subfamily serine protease